jgi:DNA invertase Pin-like site-specific DNA recombinase
MNAFPTVSILGHHPKIRPTHLDRFAYIYVRQSSPKQVAHNQESTMLQYQLAHHAERLGWRADRVRAIDDDQATSAASSAGRDGFQELVTEVSLGRVGIIFGWQVSRVARNNSDWYHLLDLAALSDTLIADIDGVYDLRDYNDRLLLGLKGAMSEAELYLMQQRLKAGRLNQIQRGAYRQSLPTGLVRLEDGRVMKDPDDQVRHAIELVLRKFDELGSCGQVMRYCRTENILLPRRQLSGPFRGELLWKPANDMAIYQIVCNPAYAGAFVYGRRQVDRTRQIPGKRRTGKRPRPMTEWLQVHRDVYPAYISWEQYVANQERLHQNAMNFNQTLEQAQGAPREGAALLQGLVRCGQCGCLMRVSYKSRTHYFCAALARRAGEHKNLQIAGAPLETAVVQAFFDALRPANIDALEAVLAQQAADHQRLIQQWEERLKRARYEEQLAQRHYKAVDPENRLVAAELERRWESALRTLRDTQDAFDRFQLTPQPTTLPPDLRAQLKHLSETLPTLWPTLPHDQQKALLRSLIAQVICWRDTPDRLEVKLVWISGHYSMLHVQHPLGDGHDLPNYAQLVQRVEVLWQQGLDDAHMAAQLTTEGFHSARRAIVPPSLVEKIRREHGWHLALARSRQALELDGYLTVRGLAAQLGVACDWVYNRLYSGTIPASFVTRHPQSQGYLIRPDPTLLAHLRALAAERSA